MLILNGSVDYIEFDSKKYTEAFVAYVEDLMRLAAGEFAKAALARIPVRTGFVAGAFGSLEDLLGTKARLNPIVSTVREFYYPPGGTKILKTPESGRAFATQGHDIFKREGTTLTFSYDIDITYFKINEASAGFAPTAPWQAFTAGEKAFVDYIEKNLGLKQPDANDYIKITTVRL